MFIYFIIKIFILLLKYLFYYYNIYFIIFHSFTRAVYQEPVLTTAFGDRLQVSDYLK